MHANIDIFIYENFTFGAAYAPRHYKHGLALNWRGFNPSTGNGPLYILPDAGGAYVTMYGNGHLSMELKNALRQHFGDENFKDFAAIYEKFKAHPQAVDMRKVRLVK